ncbi:MAG: tetratricopeptide repeat protein, partial [Chloroflexi bacterium]|nr:tetratricopeptide repeat protein [Chloroflexota bacterium]
YVNRVVIPTVPPLFIPTATATRDPETYVTEAEALYNEGKLLQAIDVYWQAVRARPDDETIYIALARVQVFAGQYEEALASAENALLLNPNNATAYAVQGWAFTFLGNYIGADESIKEALRMDPLNPLAHAYYVELLVSSGSYESLLLAIDESRVALDLAPNSLEAHRARGLVLEVTDNREEAALEYQKAIEINPNIPDLHLALGRTYRALGAGDLALEEFTKANTLNPSDPTPELFISRYYATIGEYAKAEQYAEAAVQDDQTDPYLRGNWGVVLYRLPDLPAAAVQLSLAVNGGLTEAGETVLPIRLTSDIRVVEFFSIYGLLLAKTGRCPEALPVFQLILASVPDDETAVYNAGVGQDLCENSLKTPSPTPTVPVTATPTATSTP